MFLAKAIVLNNKSCKIIKLEPSKDSPEILIGINDCGKSTILKSLDLFFDERKVCDFISIEQQKNDLSNSPLTEKELKEIFKENSYPEIDNYNKDTIYTICEFNIEEKDLLEKSFQENTKNNHLKWALENSDTLVIMKMIQRNADSMESTSDYYILIKDYKDSDGINIEAWNKGKIDLKKIRSKLSVLDSDILNENGKGKFRNIEEIRAIYNKIHLKLISRWSLYKDFSKDKNFFPSIKYFDWNFSFKDLENLATDAMKEVLEPIINEIQNTIDLKQKEATSLVNEKFEELMKGLKDELPQEIQNIKSSVFLEVNKRITDITITKDGADGVIHLENQGEGIKRQIWFAILKWRSQQEEFTGKNKYIWCFDEPETHLYPSAQRKLFSTFKEMCKKEFQVIISTHSTLFIDRVKISSINKVSLNNGYSIMNKVTDIDDIFYSLGILNSDFLFFDKFIAVEGYTEMELIPHFYKLKYNKTLIEDGIQLINLKGERQSKNNREILEKMFSDFQKTSNRLFYLFDSDTNETGKNIFLVGQYDLEDSIPNIIWIQFLRDICNVNITDEIINTEIRSNLDGNHSNKFHSLLYKYIDKNKSELTKPLPSKNECGKLLTKYFSDVNYIPSTIIDLFESLAD